MSGQDRSGPSAKLDAAQEALRALWEEHVQCEFATHNTDDTLATMVADAYVNHIPVLTGGVGRAQLRRSCSNPVTPQIPPYTPTTPISQPIRRHPSDAP